MHTQLTPGRLLAAGVVALSLWIVHGFVEAVVAACVTAIASWPLYERFRSHLSPRLRGRTGAVVFTAALTLFVLAPLVFAGWALLDEARVLQLNLAHAASAGLGVPPWVAGLPAVGPWLAERWQDGIGHPDGLVLSRHANPTALLGWLQSLGRFTFHHALIVAFTVLLLCFLYEEGMTLQRALTRALRQAVGDRAGRYVELATRAIRASVNSMLAVGLFDALASTLAFAIAGAPRPWLWGAITGALAAVPFLGYAAVAGLALQLSAQDGATPALLSLLLGCAVLFAGDKVVRPLVLRDGIRLPFVWLLMGCIGGFGALGLTGLVIGPVVLCLARELWEQHAGSGRR